MAREIEEIKSAIQTAKDKAQAAFKDNTPPPFDPEKIKQYVLTLSSTYDDIRKGLFELEQRLKSEEDEQREKQIENEIKTLNLGNSYNPAGIFAQLKPAIEKYREDIVKEEQKLFDNINNNAETTLSTYKALSFDKMRGPLLQYTAFSEKYAFDSAQQAKNQEFLKKMKEAFSHNIAKQISEEKDFDKLYDIFELLKQFGDIVYNGKPLLDAYREKAKTLFEPIIQNLSQNPNYEGLKKLGAVREKLTKIHPEYVTSIEFQNNFLNIQKKLENELKNKLNNNDISFSEKITAVSEHQQTLTSLPTDIIILIAAITAAQIETLKSENITAILSQDLVGSIQTAIKTFELDKLSTGANKDSTLSADLKEKIDALKSTVNDKTVIDALEEIRTQNLPAPQKLAKINLILSNCNQIYAQIPTSVTQKHQEIYKNLVALISKDLVENSKSLFNQLNTQEFTQEKAEKNLDDANKSKTYHNITDAIKTIINNVIASILTHCDYQASIIAAKAWIEIAAKCFAEGDISTATSIYTALSNEKLTKIINLATQSASHKKMLDNLRMVMDSSLPAAKRNQKISADILGQEEKKTVVPNIITYAGEIMLLAESNTTTQNDMDALKNQIKQTLEHYKDQEKIKTAKTPIDMKAYFSGIAQSPEQNLSLMKNELSQLEKSQGNKLINVAVSDNNNATFVEKVITEANQRVTETTSYINDSKLPLINHILDEKEIKNFLKDYANSEHGKNEMQPAEAQTIVNMLQDNLSFNKLVKQTLATGNKQILIQFLNDPQNADLRKKLTDFSAKLLNSFEIFANKINNRTGLKESDALNLERLDIKILQKKTTFSGKLNRHLKEFHHQIEKQLNAGNTVLSDKEKTSLEKEMKTIAERINKRLNKFNRSESLSERDEVNLQYMQGHLHALHYFGTKYKLNNIDNIKELIDKPQKILKTKTKRTLSPEETARIAKVLTSKGFKYNNTEHWTAYISQYEFHLNDKNINTPEDRLKAHEATCKDLGIDWNKFGKIISEIDHAAYDNAKIYYAQPTFYHGTYRKKFIASFADKFLEIAGNDEKISRLLVELKYRLNTGNFVQDFSSEELLHKLNEIKEYFKKDNPVVNNFMEAYMAVRQIAQEIEKISESNPIKQTAQIYTILNSEKNRQALASYGYTFNPFLVAMAKKEIPSDILAIGDFTLKDILSRPTQQWLMRYGQLLEEINKKPETIDENQRKDAQNLEINFKTLAKDINLIQSKLDTGEIPLANKKAAEAPKAVESETRKTGMSVSQKLSNVIRRKSEPQGKTRKRAIARSETLPQNIEDTAKEISKLKDKTSKYIDNKASLNTVAEDYKKLKALQERYLHLKTAGEATENSDGNEINNDSHVALLNMIEFMNKKIVDYVDEKTSTTENWLQAREINTILSFMKNDDFGRLKQYLSKEVLTATAKLQAILTHTPLMVFSHGKLIETLKQFATDQKLKVSDSFFDNIQKCSVIAKKLLANPEEKLSTEEIEILQKHDALNRSFLNQLTTVQKATLRETLRENGIIDRFADDLTNGLNPFIPWAGKSNTQANAPKESPARPRKTTTPSADAAAKAAGQNTPSKTLADLKNSIFVHGFKNTVSLNFITQEKTEAAKTFYTALTDMSNLAHKIEGIINVSEMTGASNAQLAKDIADILKENLAAITNFTHAFATLEKDKNYSAINKQFTENLEALNADDPYPRFQHLQELVKQPVAFLAECQMLLPAMAFIEIPPLPSIPQAKPSTTQVADALAELKAREKPVAQTPETVEEIDLNEEAETIDTEENQWVKGEKPEGIRLHVDVIRPEFEAFRNIENGVLRSAIFEHLTRFYQNGATVSLPEKIDTIVQKINQLELSPKHFRRNYNEFLKVVEDIPGLNNLQSEFVAAIITGSPKLEFDLIDIEGINNNDPNDLNARKIKIEKQQREIANYMEEIKTAIPFIQKLDKAKAMELENFLSELQVKTLLLDKNLEKIKIAHEVLENGIKEKQEALHHHHEELKEGPTFLTVSKKDTNEIAQKLSPIERVWILENNKTLKSYELSSKEIPEDMQIEIENKPKIYEATNYLKYEPSINSTPDIDRKMIEKMIDLAFEKYNIKNVEDLNKLKIGKPGEPTEQIEIAVKYAKEKMSKMEDTLSIELDNDEVALSENKNSQNFGN